MKKTLLASAVAAGCLGISSLAQADITLFGHLDESIIAWDEDTGVNKFSGGAGGNDDITLACTTCSVGFKGSEDLGNGLKAIFKLDFQFDINNRNRVSGGAGTGAITDRDQWVGLAGEGWGSVKFGSISSGYKSTGAMIDPVYRTVAQARDMGLQSNLHSGAGENGQGRMTNHIRYDSPSFSGFKAIVDYTLDGNDTDGSSDNAWALTGLYKNGPIVAFASYITSDQGGNDDAWKIGGSYAVTDELKVFGQYESDGGLISASEGFGGASIRNEGGQNPNNVDGADIWHIGATYNLGNNLVYFAYGRGDDASGNGTTYDVSYSTWSLVGAHMFSKRTMLYAGFVQQDFDATGEADVFALGMKHKF